MQPPLWQNRDLVGGGLGPVVAGLQTGSTVGIFSMLSSVPKLHVDRSSSETIRPPLIYWAPSRLQAATFVANRHLVGAGLGPVATGLQTGSTIALISKLSSVPKLHVDRSNSETPRPPPLIYWAPSRIHAAT